MSAVTAWQSGQPRFSGRMQNSRPVAARFMAAPKPKITSPKQPEAPVNPFSPELTEKLKQSGRWRRVAAAMGNGGRQQPAATQHGNATPSQPSTAAKATKLTVGAIVEHRLFGRGTVLAVEGTGENSKAIIHFDETGRKQLLLKFAKLTIV